MHFTEITEQDSELWLALRQQLYHGLDERFHRQEMHWLLSSPEHYCLFLTNSTKQPIGLLELSLRNIVDGCIDGPVGYIEGLYLLPEYRGQGLGKNMLQRAAQWFSAQGCSEMATDAELDNRMAQEFYDNQGFTRLWEIVQFKKAL